MAAGLDALRVLIVDDNVHMVHIVRAILRGFGFTDFVEARTAEEALNKIEDQPVDLIICDYLMGEMSGLDMVRQIRSEDSANPYLPIIMLSAYSEKARVEEARDAGVTEFCTKPVTPASLYRKIAAIIDHPRPFVRTSEFFGPDRRRRKDAEYDGPARRDEDDAADDAAKEAAA